jgi:hypothetical protein
MREAASALIGANATINPNAAKTVKIFGNWRLMAAFSLFR